MFGRSTSTLGRQSLRSLTDFENDNIVIDEVEENEPRLILVAKALPLNIKKLENSEEKWSIEWNDPRDFLSNLRVLQLQSDLVFVGIPPLDIDEKDRDLFEQQLDKFCETNGIAAENGECKFKVHCQPVYLDSETKERFFGGFCKRVLWPTLHYDLPHRNKYWALNWNDSWQAYRKVNLEYSRVATSCAESTRDMFWIHNYHLFLTPSFIRNKLTNARIGYFMHTPFPSSDCFRVLPSGKEILQSLLTADLIGFHTFDYVRYFLSCCKRILELDFETMPGGRMGMKFNGRMVSVIISHCGIHSEFFKERASDKYIIEKAKDIRERYKGRRIITTGVDDLDVVKGPILKFQAYRRFLEKNEAWRDKVVLVSMVVPGSANEDDSKYVRMTTQKEINLIKKQFGDSVISVEEKPASLDDIIAINVASDIGFISTFWDGLNVAPYEYTACQTKKEPGVLILSEFMGCSRALSGVLRVNPWSLDEVSDTLHQALSLSMKDRQIYHERRYPYVMQHTAENWGVHFIKNIEEASKLVVDLNIMTVGFGPTLRLVGLRPDFFQLKQEKVTKSYRHSTERIILCDYDGTLIDNKDRGTCGPSPEALIALHKLCADSSNTVFVVSGRPRNELQKWFSCIENLGLAAEKGAFLRWPVRLRNSISCLKTEKMGDDEWEIICASSDTSWKIIAREIMNKYKEHTAGSWIEDKELSIVWHYESADSEFGRMQAREMEKVLIGVIDQELIEVVVYGYTRIVEVKPQGIGKGLTATRILKRVLKSPNNTNPSSSSSTSLSPSLSASFSPSVSPPSFQSLERPNEIPSATSATSTITTTAPTIATKETKLENNNKKPFLLCLGDDLSDEEMFVALLSRADLGVDPRKILIQELLRSKDASDKTKDRVSSVRIDKKQSKHTFTCCVGLRPGSNAQYYVDSHEEVIDLLENLADCRTLTESEVAYSPSAFHSSRDSFSSGDHAAQGSINWFEKY